MPSFSLLRVFLSVVSIFMGVSAVAAPKASKVKPERLTGNYELTRNGSLTSLNISEEKGKLTAEFAGGGDGALGAAQPADCFVRGIGVAKGKLLPGTLVQDRGPEDSTWRDLAKEHQKKFSIQFDANGAVVTGADTLGICGMNTRFDGTYKRKS